MLKMNNMVCALTDRLKIEKPFSCHMTEMNQLSSKQYILIKTKIQLTIRCWRRKYTFKTLSINDNRKLTFSLH